MENNPIYCYRVVEADLAASAKVSASGQISETGLPMASAMIAIGRGMRRPFMAEYNDCLLIFSRSASWGTVSPVLIMMYAIIISALMTVVNYIYVTIVNK